MDWPAERIFNERAERLDEYREQVKRLEADLEMQKSLTATAQDGMRQLGKDLARCRERCANMKTLEGLSIDELNARLMKLERENAALREFAAGMQELFPREEDNGPEAIPL